MESVVALFPDTRQAQVALQALIERGFERDRLAFAMTDVVAENDLGQATGVSPEAGLPGGSGTVIKGTLYGALIGAGMILPVWLILHFGNVLPENMGHFARGGLIGMLFAAIGGGALGLLFGALAGSDHGDHRKLLRTMGVPAAEAERLYAGMREGQVLVIARDESERRMDEALTIMRRSGAVKLDDVYGGGRLQSERSVYPS